MEEARTHLLIGRAPQLELIHARLDDPQHRVLTLRGPGGVGKTTIARNLAQDRAVPFVELDVCSDGDDIASAVGEALGLPDVLRNFNGVHEALSGHELDLVILDNAEHVLEAVGSVVAGWLEGTSVRFLVTSRERLRLDNESVVDIMPLEDDDALELFSIRAQDVSRHFVVDESNLADIRRLIDLVDGLPLAIELAAARVRILTPAQICDRLDQQFELLRNKGEVVDRHATLDACVAWSWNLLDDDLREGLRQIAVFRGRFTIDDAEAVVHTSGWVGDDIEELVERSLIWVDRADVTPTFVLYDGVRRFVDRRTKLDAALVERYAEFLLGRVRGEMLTHRDLTNILHAFELCIGERPDLAVNLLIEARQKLWRAGFLARLFELIARGLAVEGLDPMWRGGLHTARAMCHYALMEYGRTIEELSVAAELVAGDTRDFARRTRSQIALLRGVRADEEHFLSEADLFYAEAREGLDVLPSQQKAHLLAACGLGELRRGHFDLAISWFEQSIDAARRSPDRVLLARTLTWSASGYMVTNQIERAIARVEEALEIYAEHEDVVSLTVAQYALAQALVLKDVERAKVVAREAMSSALVGRLRVVESMTKVLVARLEPDEHSPTVIRRAMRVFGEDSNHNDRWSAWVSLLVVLVRLGELDIAAQEAGFLVASAERNATDVEVAWCRRYLAVIHALRGDVEEMFASSQEAGFAEAVKRGLEGDVDEDIEPWNNWYLRFIHDFSPAPLELLREGVKSVGHGALLVLVDDGASAILPDGTPVDLETRYVLRRLLVALCDVHDDSPGTSMTLDDLVVAGWPDETMTYESGIRRVYSAIRNLRKLGFEDIVLTSENGYLIDPDLRITRQ